MPEWIEQAVRSLTNRYEYLYRWILGLAARIKALEQGLMAAQQQQGGGGGGGSVIAYASVPGSAMSVASGNPPTGTPTSLGGQTVYTCTGGVWSALPGTYTIYNGAPSPIVAAKLCWLVPDGGSGFVIYTQSCI